MKNKIYLTLLILTAAIAAACTTAPEPTPVPPTAVVEPTEEPMEEMAEPTEEAMAEEMEEEMEMGTVGDIAMGDRTFDNLVEAVLATGLDTVVQGDDPITVFAPTNAAFEALPEGLLESLTEDQLRAILTYHVVPGAVTSDMVSGMDMGTSALGEDFTVTVDGDTIMINDATILTADIEGSNGIIHVIDTVLIPPSFVAAMAEEEMMEEDMMTVGDIAMGDRTFDILVDAVLATGLDTVVQGDDPITVFAPTNAAFEALPEGLLESLTEDQLRAVLTYHVVPGAVTSDMVSGMDMGTSALGEDFTVTVDGDTIMINDATILTADIEGSNGIIHVIDTVLIPPSFLAAMEEEMMMAEVSAIYATSNPGELENDSIVNIAPDFSEIISEITEFADGVTSVESIAVTSEGTSYLTVDLADGAGAIAALVDLGDMSPDGLVLAADLAAPKGLYVAEEAGVVIVANFGGNSIKGYDLALNPMFEITDLGDTEGSIWDVYHDAASDTLFATGTKGDLLVYADFSSNWGEDGPTKVIVPADTDGNKISVNLHGVAYDHASGSLILTDVGDAASPTDGQLFVISDAMAAEGNTTVSVLVAGPESWLGNPVDVAFDGSSAYVAEKSNDAILRFDDVVATDMMGMMGDAAPSAIFELAKAESVSLAGNHMMMDGEMMDEEAMMEEEMTVGDIAMASDTFTLLVNAVLATGLDTVVQGDDPITVFAPTNAAFEALPEGLLASLTEEQLRDVLSYHVVSGLVTSDQVAGMSAGTSALGEDFTVTVDGDTIMINNATIITADIEGSNGIIHVIDTVLIPPSMSQ